MAVLTTFTARIGVTSPIVQVFGGAAPGFLPGLPRIELAPDIIFFLAFSVILATLVLQGLSLPSLSRWLGLPRDETLRRIERDLDLEALRLEALRLEA